MKKNEWDKNFKFSKRNPYVSNDEVSFTAILPKVILKMMNKRERLRYGSTLE